MFVEQLFPPGILMGCTNTAISYFVQPCHLWIVEIKNKGKIQLFDHGNHEEKIWGRNLPYF
jgi:hypothetical protein